MAEPIGDTVVDPVVAVEPAAELPAADRTFTPADVERIVKERLTRERQKYEGFDDLKTKAEEFDKLTEANKTELEKAQARAETAEKERDRVAVESTEIRLKSAILSEAAKADRRVVDPEAALALLDRSSLEYDADGNPTNVATAMDSLLAAKPFLVAVTGGARGNADQGARKGSGANQLGLDDLKTMSPEAIQKAEAEGRLTSLMGAT